MEESTKIEDEVAKENGHIVFGELAQKMVELRKCVSYLQKETEGYQYKYVSGSQLLGKLRPKMDELGIILKTDITSHNWTTEKSVCIQMRFRWFLAEDFDMQEEVAPSISCDWVSAGEDKDPAKALGKAFTYGERYFLMKFFNIPTDEVDPDKFQGEPTKLNGTVKPAEPVFGQQPKSEPTKMDYDMRWEKICLVGESNGWSREDVKKYAGTLGYYEHTNILPQDENTFITFFSKNKSEFIAEKEA